MNIFKILANGHGRINENNISAFLGYLLDPKADHSLGHAFLEKFLEPIVPSDEEFNVYKYEYKVFFEQGINQTVDVVIVCYSDEKNGGKKSQMINFVTAEKKIHKIFLIENKINSDAFTERQLENQINSIKSEFRECKFNFVNDNLYSIYTTPDDDKYDLEFNSLSTNKNKTHIYWDSYDEEKTNSSIRSILEGLLRDENNAKIETINTYTKDTIKSFIQFIDNGFKSEVEEEKEKKEETIPAYVRRITKELYNDGLISKETIKDLQDYDYSKKTFKIYFEFIRQKDKPLNRSEKDSASGYYTTEEIFEDYYITSQWYLRHKEGFDKWTEGLKSKSIQN